MSIISNERITQPCLFRDNGNSIEFAIPVSYRQLMDAGVELNSLFDEDAGDHDTFGTIILTKEIVEEDGKLYDIYGVSCLQVELTRPEPQWAHNLEYFDDLTNESRSKRQKNDLALKTLWRQIETPELAAMIEEREREWREYLDNDDD